MAERRSMAHRLTDRDIKTIVTVIGDLDPRLRPTWQHVEDAAMTATRHSFSRQALSKKAAVATAYEAKLAEHQQVRKGGKVRKPQEAEGLERKIEAMQFELDALRRRVAELDVAHVNLVANAIRFGVPQRLLKQPPEDPTTAVTPASGKPRLVTR